MKEKRFLTSSDRAPNAAGRRSAAQYNNYRIGIIGGGPKGLYGLERLLARLAEQPLPRPVEIHVYNRSPFFGAGDIYRTDQPGYLLMNFNNGYIDMWPKEAPVPIVPNFASMTGWIQQKYPALAHHTETDYSARALVGEYLSDGFAALISYCPENVQIFKHAAEVVDLHPVGSRFSIVTKDKSSPSSLFHQILLTTGHPQHRNSEEEKAYERFSKQRKGVGFIDFIYPVSERLSTIRPGSEVAIKGMGLTFIDAVLALFEGRGGRFVEPTGWQIKYLPSGNEPLRIYPYSRSGLPMFPRGANFGLPQRKRYFLHESQLPAEGQLSFETQLLPLILQEITGAYYEVLFRQYGLKLDLTAPWEESRAHISDFHQRYPEEQPFSPESLFDPFPEKTQLDHGDVMDYLKVILSEGKKGETQSPLATAAATWRHLSSFFNQLYSFGGLDPESHRKFLKEFSGIFNRITYGPPIVNMEKIWCLAKAGYIDFSFARSPVLTLKEQLGHFLLSHADGPSRPVHYLIDARIPKTSLIRDRSELYGNLLRRGIVREFVHNGTSDKPGSFCPGCMDLTREGRPLDVWGRVVPNITVSGTPTEGLTYDNDTLSRHRNDFVSGWAQRVVAGIIKKNKN